MDEISRIYELRKLIDKYYNNEEMKLSEKEIKDLYQTYNREFTEGYLFNNSGKNLMNIIWQCKICNPWRARRIKNQSTCNRLRRTS